MPMGMAASQARFLQLTARLSNTEYEAQQINQARADLADKTARAANEYQKAVTNRTLLFDPYREAYNDKNNYQVFTYDSIVNSINEGGLEMRLVDASGKIIVPALPDGVEEGTAEANNYIIDDKVYNSKYLEEGLREKGWNLQRKDRIDDWVNEDWRSTAGVFDVFDKSDDGAAEAKYTELTTLYQSQDKKLELRQKQLESEHSALQTEYDAVKKVIDKNVETTFKTFG